ncbi:motility associated factor glycosyltransferase family protein [Alkalihalobacterium bogoriense]|uniref:motility associated factor glycosyltransferase family protein n=1 Tax=Alkalihalobacterium bogoriense TaxID=246272 RepID=UPI00047C5D76|nr:6-hydroxymethylpterin diphosphokinase MptE-like protein [Alkalihalobacterium bogoriense]
MKNILELVKEKNYFLYEKISSHKVTREIETVISKDNITVYRLVDNEGKLFYSHSKYNAHNDVVKHFHNIDLKSRLFIILGIGAGSEVKYLLKKKIKAAKVVVIEPNLDLLIQTLNIEGNQEILQSNDVYLMGGSIEDINKQLQLYSDRLVVYSSVNAELIQLTYINRLYEQEYLKSILKEFREAIVSRTMRIGNSVEDTLLGINHFFSNVLYTFDNPQLREARKYYEGRPAICVASGPSLDKNVDLLHQVKDKALIFCADSAYEKLLKKGIISDVTSVMERPKIIYNYFFKDKTHLYDEKTCLLSQVVAYPKIFQEYPGTKVVCSKKELRFEQLASEHIPTLNNFPNGLSCAHLSFATAILLGCNPIVMIGQDLAYGNDGKSHAKSTQHENNTVDDDVNQIKYEILSYNKKDKVLTTSIWDTFRRWFEEVIATNPGITYINATEGGANIEGATPIPLQEVIETYMNDLDEKPEFRQVMESVRPTQNLDEVKKGALAFFQSELKQLDEIEKIISSVLSSFEKLHTKYVQLKNKDDLITEKNFKVLVSGITKLEKSYIMNDNVSFITQAMQARFRQIVHKYSHIEDVGSFISLLKGSGNKADELKNTLDKIKEEYIRGIEILTTGKVKSIDTPLMNEMFED